MISISTIIYIVSVKQVEDSNVVSIQNPKAATSIDFTEPVNIEGEEDFNPKPELTPFTEPREEEALLKEEKKYDDLDSASVTRKSRNTIEGAQTDEDIGAHTEDWHSETNQKTETILQSEQSESTKLQKEIKAAAEKGFESKHQGNKEINEAWIGCSQPPPIRNSEDHASTETIEIVEQKHWKESNTVDGSSKFGDQEDVSETNSDNILSEIQKIEELTPEDKGEKCKEESKLEYEKTEKNLDSVPEIHNDDTVSKIEKPEIKKSRSKADIAELTAQENHCEKEVEANETITNKTSDEKVNRN